MNYSFNFVSCSYMKYLFSLNDRKHIPVWTLSVDLLTVSQRRHLSALPGNCVHHLSTGSSYLLCFAVCYLNFLHHFYRTQDLTWYQRLNVIHQQSVMIWTLKYCLRILPKRI